LEDLKISTTLGGAGEGDTVGEWGEKKTMALGRDV
jgi:hypothetical protein